MKGHMLHVEGGYFPKKVHRTHKSAFRELHRLAALNPGKKVYMFQLTDRFVYENEGPAKSVGTHLPADERMVVDEEDLVRGATLKKPQPLIENQIDLEESIARNQRG